MTYGDSTLRKTLQGQGRVLLFNYWLTYCVLKAKKPRFQQLLPPTEAAPSAGAPESEPMLNTELAASSDNPEPVPTVEGNGGGDGA